MTPLKLTITFIKCASNQFLNSNQNYNPKLFFRALKLIRTCLSVYEQKQFLLHNLQHKIRSWASHFTTLDLWLWRKKNYFVFTSSSAFMLLLSFFSFLFWCHVAANSLVAGTRMLCIVSLFKIHCHLKEIGKWNEGKKHKGRRTDDIRRKEMTKNCMLLVLLNNRSWQLLCLWRLNRICCTFFLWRFSLRICKVVRWKDENSWKFIIRKEGCMNA